MGNSEYIKMHLETLTEELGNLRAAGVDTGNLPTLIEEIGRKVEEIERYAQ